MISSPPSAGTPRCRPLWSRPAASASCGCCAPRRWGPRSRAGARTRRPSAARTRRGGTRSAAASTAPPLSAACDASESTGGRERGPGWRALAGRGSGRDGLGRQRRWAGARGSAAPTPGFPAPVCGGHLCPHFIGEEMERGRLGEAPQVLKAGNGEPQLWRSSLFPFLDQTGSGSGENFPRCCCTHCQWKRGIQGALQPACLASTLAFFLMETECFRSLLSPPYSHIPPGTGTGTPSQGWDSSISLVQY